jgi:hypothetical protein
MTDQNQQAAFGPVMGSWSILDAGNNDEVLAYERAFFRAFAHQMKGNAGLVFSVDRAARRIRSRISYEAQRIYVVRHADAVVMAVAAHIDASGELQLERLGFSVDRSKWRFCEIVVLFALADPVKSLLYIRELSSVFIAALRTEGFERIYGTCGRRLVRGYEQMGFVVKDTNVTAGEEECLLELDLGRVPVL